MTAPDWFTLSPTVDITTGQYDAAEFLEGDEIDYEFRLCQVPASLLRPVVVCPDELPAILDWIDTDHGGNATAALVQAPVVMLLTSDGPKIVDGHRRTALAQQVYGLTSIPCLVAIGESCC